MILPLYSANSRGPLECHILGPPTQEGHGLFRASPEQGHEDDQSAGELLLQRQVERVGTVQHGEEKAPGRLYMSLLHIKS